MKRRSLLWPLALSLVTNAAWAEPYNVETVGIARRADAEAAASLAVAEGLEAEVVRSFRKGRGWVFVVRVQGVDGRLAAAETAQRLAGLSGQSVQVFLVAGRDVLPVEELSVVTATSSGADTGVPELTSNAGGTDDKVARIEGARLLAAALLAHGGGRGAEAAPASAFDDWQNVHFRFERTADIGDGVIRVWHDYWRSGDDLRLEVRLLEGEGRNSITVVSGDAAWLLVDGERHEVAAGPTREALAVFEPGVVLEQAASITTWSVGLSARMVEREGSELDWLELVGDARSERVMVGLDANDHRARELVLASDAVELAWVFADYREVCKGLVVPLRLESRVGGQLREQVTVRVLERPDAMDSTLFDPAALKMP